MNQATPLVLRALDAGVLVLTLNRPERNNAWNIDLEEAYFGALADAADDPAVRAIIVTGAGKSFCPGLDTAKLADVVGGGVVTSRERRPQTFPTTIPKPIIAAINGACAGMGFIQAMVSDVRIAARGAKLTTAFARRGLPAEHGLSWILPRLIGTPRALDLLLSGRVITADEAYELGVVNRVVEPDDLLPTALAYAREMAEQCAPGAMAMIKRQVYGDLESDWEPSRIRSRELAEERQLTADFAEGVASFVERRAPNFAPYPPSP